jgi:hypothetical protein
MFEREKTLMTIFYDFAFAKQACRAEDNTTIPKNAANLGQRSITYRLSHTKRTESTLKLSAQKTGGKSDNVEFEFR